MPKTKIVKQLKTIKTFTYSEGDISLNFSLNIDYQNSLEIFKNLLNEALKDIQIEIDKFNK